MCVKPMENQRFCMPSAWVLCPIVFAFSYLGLVLSLRDVESRRRSWCPEIASDYFALTFSVSRTPFRIFALMQPAAGLNFWVLRCPAAVWPSTVVDEHLGVHHPNLAFLNGPLDTGDVIASYSYAFISPGEPMISMVFLRTLLLAVSFSDALNTPKRRSRRQGQSGHSRRRSGHASRSRPSSPSRRPRRPSRSRREFNF